MWLIPVVIAAAVGLVVYLRWFLKRVETTPSSRAAAPPGGTATLAASDLTGHVVHEAAWSQVASGDGGHPH